MLARRNCSGHDGIPIEDVPRLTQQIHALTQQVAEPTASVAVSPRLNPSSEEDDVPDNQTTLLARSCRHDDSMLKMHENGCLI